ncbi:hypothetical protein QQ045_001322 [Rhodiola kirilowii]
MVEYSEEEVLPVLKLALVCTSQIPSNRQTMAEVLQVIQTPLPHRMLIGIHVRWISGDELIAWKNSKRWSCRAQKLVAFFIITAAIYEVWRARNKCIFEGDSDSLDAVKNLIWRMLKLKLELIKNSKTGIVLQAHRTDNIFDPGTNFTCRLRWEFTYGKELSDSGTVLALKSM